jgi:nucleotide-binding universal stress UspA family protein
VSDTPAFLGLVVAGADGSPGSRRALDWTAQLALATHAEVLVVHVLTYNRELLRDMTPDTMRTWRRELRHELETSWVDALTAAHVPHRCEMVEADSPASGLLDTADAKRADLIVVGARGHGGIADRVLGGVSYRVSHRARQPVVVVPADWRKSTSRCEGAGLWSAGT